MSTPAQIPSIDEITSSQSARGITDKLAVLLPHLDQRVNDLKSWFKSIDPSTYTQDLPWPPRVLAAYKAYKRMDEELGEAAGAYSNVSARLQSRSKWVTPHEHMHCAGLAVIWAKKTVQTANARLEFLENYQNAFPHDRIEGHIVAGQYALNGAKNALKAIEDYMEKGFKASSRRADPEIFE
ncbi:hypothetical protein N7457_007070 [Penicillium paradoxum]|uniref:uncharacterized protein n=1 Tax=Penicillium paradoxum TaxID=176176 RepID=UPI00254667B4|nr:uncharacterized protein N7457_007070 [Penicillium paradoxum]KAJ5779350.1 hypothetical protein N7457_007070 [Penicillium paradoxum]